MSASSAEPLAPGRDAIEVAEALAVRIWVAASLGFRPNLVVLALAQIDLDADLVPDVGAWLAAAAAVLASDAPIVARLVGVIGCADHLGAGLLN